MAVYRLSVQTIQRGQGRSVVAAAAYRSGAALADERLAITYDFRRKAGIEHAEIIGPANTPAALLEREALWNAAERSDRRKDAVPAREILVSLPHELSAEQRLELVREFVSQSLVKRGMVADFAIHKPDKEGDQRNFHAHILLTTREVGPQGFGAKKPDWNLPTFVTDARHEWARVQNKHLQLALGPKAPKVSEKSLADRGVNLAPSPKMGPAVTAMDRRSGLTDRKAERQHWELRNERARTKTRELDEQMKPSVMSRIERSVADLRGELTAIRDQLVRSRDGFTAEREAIDVPRPPSIKSLEFEATKAAFVARKRAQKQLEWVEARAKERGSRPADLRRIAAWISNPLGTLASSISRAHRDHKRVAQAQRDFQSADGALNKTKAWVRSEHGQAWIANKREPTIKLAIEATKQRRTLERLIKRYDVRISQADLVLKRLDLAKELKVTTLKVPEKIPTRESGDAFAKRYTDAVNKPVSAAIKVFPAPTVAAAFTRMISPKPASIPAPAIRSRPPTQTPPKPEIDLDIDI